MAQPFPYTYYACPCVNTSTPLSILKTRPIRKISREHHHHIHHQQSQPPPPPQPTSRHKGAKEDNESIEADDGDKDEISFDPKSPRANFSLFPIDHLLYCSECHQMRCAKCVTEEVVCWFCPSCLFEVPSSTVRSEGNRCTRNCFNCPSCTAPLTVNPYGHPHSDESQDKDTTPSGPFILLCSNCNWSSLEIGIKLEKHNNLTSQLSKVRNGGQSYTAVKDRDIKLDSPASTDHEELFARLHLFHRTQLSQSNDPSTSSLLGGSLSSPSSYSSPGSLSRLLNIYAGKPARNKPRPMREALSLSEGLSVYDPAKDDAIIAQMRDEGWQNTTTFSQRAYQAPFAAQNYIHQNSIAFTDALRPVPALIRTKRSKRCKACRTILAKPEARMNSSRWRLLTLAIHNVPRISLRALASPASPPGPNMSLTRVLSPLDALPSGKPVNFIITATNPLFEPIKVSLATPPVTPGRVASLVTILCPQFDVGANRDVWDDDSLQSAAATTLAGSGVKRQSHQQQSQRQQQTGNEGRAIEAGQIWNTGPNWTSVVLELVPGKLPPLDDLNEDEDVLEIAVFVRLEYDTFVSATGEKKGVEGKEKREDAFWCVLGAGQIAAAP